MLFRSNFNVEDLEGGKFKITFTKRTEGDQATDFNDTGCAGGGGCSHKWLSHKILHHHLS